MRNTRTNKRKSTRQIRSKQGTVFTDTREIMNRWKDYFKQMLGSEIGNEMRTIIQNQFNIIIALCKLNIDP